MQFVYINPTTSSNDWETCPPLGLAYLMAQVHASHPNIEQHLLDFTVDPAAERRFVELALDNRPDAVFFTFMTPQAPAAYAATQAIRARWGKQVLIVHGGCHATPRPGESLRAGADAVVLKEGEDVILDLVRVAAEDPCRRRDGLSKVPGIAIRNSLGEPDTTAARPIKQDLDRLPFPYWDAFPLRRYSQDLHIASGLALPLVTSRGCPADCHFCSSPMMWDRRMRYRSAVNVADEMRWVLDRYGVDRFHLYDDDFLVSRRHVGAIVAELRKRGLPIRFLFQARTDSVIRLAELLPELVSVGGVAVEMGVENADEAVLAHQNKRETRDQIRKAIGLVRASGLRVASCNVMACNPGETIQGHYLQNQFLHETLGLDRIFIGNYFTLFPGSHFGDHPEQALGRNLVTDWREYSVHDVTFVPDSLLRQRPVKTKPSLDSADIIILLPVIARADRVAGADLAGRLQLRRVIEKCYQLFDGGRSLEEVAATLATNSDMEPIRALKTATKLVLACSQVGLLGDSDQLQFAPRTPEWYDRACEDAVGWYRRNRVNMFYFNDVESADDLDLLKYRSESPVANPA